MHDDEIEAWWAARERGHAFVEADREGTDRRLVVECPSCSTEFSAKLKNCPTCGACNHCP